jgi:hypothetical protein
MLWIAVMVPAVMRARASAPLSTSQRFRRRMDLIAPPSYATGRWVVVLDSPNRKVSASARKAHRQLRSQRRRRRLLVLIVLAVVGSAIAGGVIGEPWWEVHLGLNAGLALYVGALLEIKRRRAERAVKVRPLRPKRPSHVALTDDFYEPVAAAGRRF